MKVITFVCPQGERKDHMTRILGKMWLNYLISQGEVDIAPKKRESDDYRLTQAETESFGALMGEVALAEMPPKP